MTVNQNTTYRCRFVIFTRPHSMSLQYTAVMSGTAIRQLRCTRWGTYGMSPIKCITAIPARRAFASKPVFEEKDMAQLKVNGNRLMTKLHETCELGKAHLYGAQ